VKVARTKSREQTWVDSMKSTHYTLPQLSRKYGIHKANMLLILPKHDIRCAYGNRTRLWEKKAVERWLA
jgi:hypothetical protein